MHSLTYWLVGWFVRSFVCSFVRSFVSSSFILLLVGFSFVRWFIPISAFAVICTRESITPSTLFSNSLSSIHVNCPSKSVCLVSSSSCLALLSISRFFLIPDQLHYATTHHRSIQSHPTCLSTETTTFESDQMPGVV